ncbi:MAG TPA: carboxypeptidase regulatory-like domain-containing protein, partial [Gemmataceae bacterium]|nr:carboxypeptidase regulatory-like domain-containing protein [Gemmataceae bacterium]
AATLRGRVTDPNGKPIAGAQVWAAFGLMTALQEGVRSTRTDADGRYAITDMGASLPDDFKPRPIGKNLIAMGSWVPFDVLHPDYGHERPMYSRIPATVDVVLRPAGIVEGKVIDQVTGKPAAGVLVGLSTTSASRKNIGKGARTDASGKYRFLSLPAAKYNLRAEAPDRTCIALDSFAVEAGKTYTAPDLALIEGGWIEGRVVDAETGKPLSGRVKGWPLTVGLYGPSRPRSGSECQSCRVDDRGRFRLRVAPGTNYPYIMSGDYWERTEGRESFEKGVEVKAGQVLRVTFRVLPAHPEP